MDKDHSGLITFNELERMVRDQLKLTTKELPLAALQALWCWIDADDSNSVQTHEFGRFMMLAVPKEVIEGVAARRAEEHRRKMKAKMLEDQEARKLLAGYTPTTKEMRAELEEAGFVPANEEMQMVLSTKFNEGLDNLKPAKNQTKSWLTLFKLADVDGSGNISYDELLSLIRNHLKLSKEDLSEWLVKALWVALDADSGGAISVQEFGRFMRLHDRQKRTVTVSKRTLPPPSRPAKGLPPAPGSNRPTGVFAEAMILRGNPTAPLDVQPMFPWRSRKCERPISPPSARVPSPTQESPPQQPTPPAVPNPIGKGFQSPRPGTSSGERPRSPVVPPNAIDVQYEKLVAAHLARSGSGELRRKGSAGSQPSRPVTAHSSSPRTPAKLPGVRPASTDPGARPASSNSTGKPRPPSSSARGTSTPFRPFSAAIAQAQRTRLPDPPGPRSPYGGSPRPMPASPMVGARRGTRASYQASVWSMHDATPPEFAAIGPVERDYMHGIEMYRRIINHAIERCETLTGVKIDPESTASLATSKAQAQFFNEFMKLDSPRAKMSGKGERLPVP